jgi:hypothetical protein
VSVGLKLVRQNLQEDVQTAVVNPLDIPPGPLPQRNSSVTPGGDHRFFAAPVKVPNARNNTLVMSVLEAEALVHVLNPPRAENGTPQQVGAFVVQTPAGTGQ